MFIPTKNVVDVGLFQDMVAKLRFLTKAIQIMKAAALRLGVMITTWLSWIFLTLNMSMEEVKVFDEKEFKPVGTMVFIALLLGLTMLVWFSVYNLQLERQNF